MPAWDQVHGGPFTDEEVRSLVAFIRNWEPEAPDRQIMAVAGNPVEGVVIFNSTCIVCHGQDGLGTERAPALNDPVKLAQFNDEWYADTITEGRPAQGMPTWGTVLSPEQVHDLVSLLRAWERGETVQPPGPEEGLTEALHMLEHGDLHAAEHALGEAMQGVTGDVLDSLNKAIEALAAGDAAAAAAAIQEAQEGLGMEMPGDMHDEGGTHNDIDASMDGHDDGGTHDD
jgi:mono/diheme cytochrome c family protein